MIWFWMKQNQVPPCNLSPKPYSIAFENLMGIWRTFWELWWEHLMKGDEKTMGTLKIRKILTPLLSPQIQEEKTKPPMPSHWLHEISISKMVCHHLHFHPLFLLLLLLIRWGASQFLLVFKNFIYLSFILWTILIGHHQTKKKKKPNKFFGNSSKYKFLCEDLVSPFCPPYGIKVLCYWEHNGEHMENLGNIIENIWKHDGNTNVFKKILCPHPLQPPRKKVEPSLLHVHHLNGCSHSFAWSNTPS